MPSISPVEIMVVAILALIVFGPNKLPEIARTVGRTLSELRRQAEDLKTEFKDGMSLDDEDEKPAATTEPVDKPQDKPGDEPLDKPLDPPSDETVAESAAATEPDPRPEDD